MAKRFKIDVDDMEERIKRAQRRTMTQHHPRSFEWKPNMGIIDNNSLKSQNYFSES